MGEFTVPDQMPAPEAVDIASAAPLDPEAPYGRLANGKARKTPPKGPKQAAAPKAAPPRQPRAKTAPTDFRPVVAEGLNMLSVPLMALGRHNRAFLADAAAIQLNAGDVAHALNEVAKINPQIQRMLTTTAPAVPYVLLGSALFNLGVQIAANHGLSVPLPGAKVHDPGELADAMEDQMRTAQRQAKEQEAAAAHDANRPKPGPPPSREHAFAAGA